MIFFVLLVICGATHRVTRLVTQDVILDAPRTWVTDHAPRSLAYFVECAWCVSMWVSAAVVLVVDLFATVPLPWAVILTASAFTGIVESHMP